MATYKDLKDKKIRFITMVGQDYIDEIEELLKKELKKTDNFIYSIEELSSKIPYSHGYICREFKKYMKQTIVNFFNVQKINYASFLLMNTNLKILDIATTIGYSSPKNFINQFTKMYQMSPSEWRKKNQLSSRK